MSGGEKYPSVFERVIWTNGFTLAIDKHVLGTLAKFADFKTGKGARPSVAALAKRAEVKRSTLMRSLRRLEDEGWIRAHRQHRWPTAYDIQIDKLDPHWREAKLVHSLSPTDDTQIADLSPTGGTQFTTSLSPTDGQLSPTDDTQIADLSPTDDTQIADLSPTGGTPSPVRTDPQVQRSPVLIPRRAPSLRAGFIQTDQIRTGTLFPIIEAKVPAPDGTVALPNWGDAESEGSDAAPESSAADGDVPADRGDRARGPAADASVGFWGAARAHQAAASRAGVSARQRSTAPRAPSADRSGARAGSQPTLGPLDVSGFMAKFKADVRAAEAQARAAKAQAADVGIDAIRNPDKGRRRDSRRREKHG
jgi:hypothetical protein